MNQLARSIQEIEKAYWEDLDEYSSRLAKECHALRKVKIKDLQIHQMITLLIQDIGSEILMPVVLEKMAMNILQEDDYDGSSFIESIDFFSDEIWKRNPELYEKIMELLKDKQVELEGKWGWKLYKRKIRKMEDKISTPR